MPFTRKVSASPQQQTGVSDAEKRLEAALQLRKAADLELQQAIAFAVRKIAAAHHPVKSMAVVSSLPFPFQHLLLAGSTMIATHAPAFAKVLDVCITSSGTQGQLKLSLGVKHCDATGITVASRPWVQTFNPMMGPTYPQSLTRLR